ncbi:response regulator transcription factor [Gracilibacillus dipsosauri]|uniref:DNA-binding response regulator n=1 Tax=Gracilibacillus dipsosauri TaxID=178340 RepID=A0A317KYV0_9BACI|nr:response regulator [Gracilibacillus dipsosauri]PWU67950.1 DNA-binding response regulator [Gracilibacillus dipsosauri]
MTKWKVLIADDEFIIRDGIRTAVDWAKFDMEVVGEAEDGEEAVEIALADRIDILLIDLNMPILNGIEAMKKIKAEIDCRMIVISGYDDFQYAQEAIRLQVEDYILKPVNPDNLIHILQGVKNDLERREKQEAYLEQASKQIKKNHSQLKERFFFDWIHNRLQPNEIQSQLEFLQLPTAVPKQLVLLKWSNDQVNYDLLSNQDRKIYLSAIENIAEEILADTVNVIIHDSSQWLQIFVWEDVTKEIAVPIEEAVKLYLNQTVYTGMVRVEDGDYQHLIVAYERCKNEINNYIHLSPIVKQALTIMRRNYCRSDLTLELVAENLHVSTVYLSKMIKQELGQSYVQIVANMRIRRAKELLKDSDLNIRDIAEKVGFDSQHYFSTAFKKKEGVSPKQYKMIKS